MQLVLPLDDAPRRHSSGLPTTFHSARMCCATGLQRGDCPHPAEVRANYCYYHEKVRTELLEPEVSASYPVLPLPNFPWKLRINEQSAA
jgi:hypothetical protein